MMEGENPSSSSISPPPARARGGAHPVHLFPALFLTTVALFLIYLREFRFDTVLVVGESMEPGIHAGDRLISRRDAYDGRKKMPRRGDVVVVYAKDERSTIVKRVVGLPGEWVASRGGVLWVEDKPLNEPYVREPMMDAPWAWRVPDGMLWVMGDNRNFSMDSRDYGPIAAKYIRGKIRWRFWPLRGAGAIG